MTTNWIEVTSPEQLRTVKCSIEERETTINIEYLDKSATISTSDNTKVTKLKKLWIKNLSGWKVFASMSRGDVVGYKFVTSRNNISFKNSTKGTRTRVMTEEQRRLVADRLHGRSS